MKEIARFERKFQIWAYTVSHAQLILRSTKDKNNDTLIDILFKNTYFLQLPTMFFGLTILELGDEETSATEPFRHLGSLSTRWFRVEGKDWQGLVGAGHVSWLEEDAEYYAASKLLSWPIPT